MRQSTTITTIIVISVALVALQFWNSQRGSPPSLPPLARDLPKDVRAADQAFKARVAQRFPKGTPGGAVAKELAAEGFRTEDGAAPWRSAVLKRTMFPCEIVWRVRWREDAAARVAETGASYGLTCP